EVDIEDSDVEGRVLCRVERFLDPRRLRSDRVAELAQHVLEQHANHQLVLDDKDARALGCCAVMVRDRAHASTHSAARMGRKCRRCPLRQWTDSPLWSVELL